MLPHLSALWLSVGTAFLATTVDGACTSPSLCGLHTLAYTHKRFWGTYVTYPIPNAQYKALATNFNEFGMIKPINAFSIATIQPSQGSFSWTATDAIVNYWLSNTKARLWTSPLLPITGLPTWLANGSWNQGTLTTIIQNHVSAVASRYKGKMYAWDVVSGVFNGDGQWHPNVFYNTLGPNYVKIALQAARAADPTAKLYIEEYAAQRLSAKSDALFALVQSLKASGVPLDGVAFEGQFSPGDPLNMASVTANTARFAGLGLGWAFTELGVRNINGPITPSQQQDYYVAVVLVCLNSPKCIGVLTSGIVDAYTLYGTSSGSLSWTETLFDANYQTVLAYYGIADKLATATIDGSYA